MSSVQPHVIGATRDAIPATCHPCHLRNRDDKTLQPDNCLADHDHTPSLMFSTPRPPSVISEATVIGPVLILAFVADNAHADRMEHGSPCAVTPPSRRTEFRLFALGRATSGRAVW